MHTLKGFGFSEFGEPMGLFHTLREPLSVAAVGSAIFLNSTPKCNTLHVISDHGEVLRWVLERSKKERSTAIPIELLAIFPTRAIPGSQHWDSSQSKQQYGNLAKSHSSVH